MASGDTLIPISPISHDPPSSNYPTVDIRNNHKVLDFDASTAETTYFTCVLPKHYSGLGLTVILHWMATSATTGSVVWSAAVERMSDGSTDLDADSFASAVSQATTVPATSGVATTTSIALTNAQIDGMVAGDLFRLAIQRVATNGSDTASGDAELLYVEVRET